MDELKAAWETHGKHRYPVEMSIRKIMEAIEKDKLQYPTLKVEIKTETGEHYELKFDRIF